MKLFCQKKGMLVHLHRLFILIKLYISYLHTHSTFSTILFWSFPHSSKPVIKISPAVTNTFNVPLNNSSIFFWNMSSTGAAPNGSLIYISTCQVDKKKLLNILIFYLALGYDSQRLHQLMKGISCMPTLVECHSMLGLCLQVWSALY